MDECKKPLQQQKLAPEYAKTATPSDSHISYYDQAFIASSKSYTDETYDTGATSHMSAHEDQLSNFKSIEPCPIGVAAQGVEIWAKKMGSVRIGTLKLDNVLFCKELTGTLISVGRLCDAGYWTVFTSTRGFVIDRDGQIVTRMIRDPTSDRLWNPLQEPENALSTSINQTARARLWHQRLGHAHPDAVISLLKSINQPPLC